MKIRGCYILSPPKRPIPDQQIYSVISACPINITAFANSGVRFIEKTQCLSYKYVYAEVSSLMVETADGYFIMYNIWRDMILCYIADDMLWNTTMSISNV